MLTFANAWDLLNIWRAVASCYLVQLFGDVTHKASQAAFNKLGFGVNMLGSRFAPWTYTLIPRENGQHKKHFKCMDVYEEFYDFVNCIMRCW